MGRTWLRFPINLLAAGVALLRRAVPGGAARHEAGPPAYAGDFADPALLIDGDRYWAYATGTAGRNLQVIHSADLRSWSEPLDPLPQLPTWAAVGHTWAPVVGRIGGRFVMYYTVRHASSGRQCISLATAASPSGPFTDERDEPLVFQRDRFGSIDPDLFVAGGERYLLWKSEDNAGGQPTSLWAQRLSGDGMVLLEGPVQLLEQAQHWQRGIVEGPAMVAAREGLLVFYGGSDWSSASAGIGYATCQSPLGPCTDRSRWGPWLGSRPGALGPAGPAPFVDRAGILRLAYHAWPGAVGYEHGGVRSLFINALQLDRRGRPTLA